MAGAVVVSSVLLPAVPANAAGASIYLTANHTLLSDGSTLIVAVYMNGGGNPINAVEADLNYPTSKLQYVGLNYSGGAFSISTPGDGGGNGSVSIQNGSVNPVSGSGLIATVTFRSLSGSGSAYIGVSGSSNLINANTNQPVPFSSSGVSVKFGAGSNGSSVSYSNARTSSPAAPAVPKDTTPPVISAVKVKNLSPFGATVTWTTNEPGSSEVDYGLDGTYGLTASSSAMTTAHSVVLDSNFLTPETVFHYHVKSADASGNVGVSPDQHFELPGVPVTIVVLGANGKPEAGATVTLDGATSTTDSRGKVTLPSSLGNKKITTTFQGVTVQKPITVARTAKPLPPFQLDMARQPLNRWMLTSVLLFVVILVLLGIDAVLFGSRFLVRLAGLHLAPALPAVHLPRLRFERAASAAPPPAESAAADSGEKPHIERFAPALPPDTQAKPPEPAETPGAGFNVQTTGDNPTPPTLRAIDNIQPLSIRRAPAPPTLSPSVPSKRIAVVDTPSDEAPAADVPEKKPEPAKPPAAKKRRPRKSHKTTKKPAKNPQAPAPTPPAA